MWLAKISAAAICLASVTLLGFVAAWQGSVYLYKDVDFSGTLYPIDISTTQQCFNLPCFDDQISSTRWVGLPSTGKIRGKSHIAFYTVKNCFGPHVHFPIDYKAKGVEYPNDVDNFGRFALDDKISSFMIWETSEEVRPNNGLTTTCIS